MGEFGVRGFFYGKQLRFWCFSFCVWGFGDPRANFHSPFSAVFHDSGSVALKISLHGKKKAASSAYADSVMANYSTPRTILWRRPVMMESCFDLKRQGEVSSFCFHVFVIATMYIIKIIRPKTSPCFTPIIDSISASAPSMEICTMMQCRAMMSRINFGGDAEL